MGTAIVAAPSGERAVEILAEDLKAYENFVHKPGMDTRFRLRGTVEVTPYRADREGVIYDSGRS